MLIFIASLVHFVCLWWESWKGRIIERSFRKGYFRLNVRFDLVVRWWIIDLLASLAYIIAFRGNININILLNGVLRGSLNLEFLIWFCLNCRLEWLWYKAITPVLQAKKLSIEPAYPRHTRYGQARVLAKNIDNNWWRNIKIKKTRVHAVLKALIHMADSQFYTGTSQSNFVVTLMMAFTM